MVADGVTYEFLSDEEAMTAYQCLNENAGNHPEGENCKWESAEQMKKRVMGVLKNIQNMTLLLLCVMGQ